MDSTSHRQIIEDILKTRADGTLIRRESQTLEFKESFNFSGIAEYYRDFAVRDLRVYADTLGGTVKHYRDNAGLECDAVIKLEDGRWGGIEIKLGGDDLIEEGASSLLTLRNKIVEKSDEKAPSFLLVLTAVGSSYKREDGVYVVPIGCLKD